MLDDQLLEPDVVNSADQPGAITKERHHRVFHDIFNRREIKGRSDKQILRCTKTNALDFEIYCACGGDRLEWRALAYEGISRRQKAHAAGYTTVLSETYGSSYRKSAHGAVVGQLDPLFKEYL